jgi:hypothetical protein
MSQEVIPTMPVATSQPMIYVPSRMSVWRIALAVFVGNLLCALLWFVLYFCLIFGLGFLGARR